MLFSATLACTRAAWCLSQDLLPENDRLHLQYRGLAMSKLRLRLSDSSPINTQSFLFTVDYMLSVSYMWKDDKALNIHLAAFRSLAQGYLATNEANDVMSSVVTHRMKSWQALDNYRKQTDLFRQRLQTQSSHQGVPPPYIWKTIPLRHLETVAKSSPALRQLSDLGLLSIELFDVLACLRHIIDNASEGLEGHAIASITRQLKIALLAEPVSDLDIQVGYALISLCYYLGPAFSTKTSRHDGNLPYPQSNSSDEHRDLDDVAQAYINRKLTRCVHDSHIGRNCALWSSILLGSILLQIGRGIDTNRPLSSGMLSEQGLKSKGHIILAATATRLASDTGIAARSQHSAEPRKGQRPPPEPDFEQLGRELIGTAGLCDMWRRSWRNTLRRQREWKEQGQLRVGNPAGLDDDEDKKISTEIEYMVLMEARQSFPVITPLDHPGVEVGEEREIVPSSVEKRDVHLSSDS